MASVPCFGKIYMVVTDTGGQARMEGGKTERRKDGQQTDGQRDRLTAGITEKRTNRQTERSNDRRAGNQTNVQKE